MLTEDLGTLDLQVQSRALQSRRTQRHLTTPLLGCGVAYCFTLLLSGLLSYAVQQHVTLHYIFP